MSAVHKSKLFEPVTVGTVRLQHRVVMAPLTRFRNVNKHIPSDMAPEYYSQRASVPGTLLISEATFVAERAGGYPYAPGVWSSEQIQGWKKVTDAVHAKGSFIFCQLWALGRAANPKELAKANLPFVSSSDVPLPETTVAPRPLTVPEIKEYAELFAQAAKNALAAGFDGVEVHGANGYLLDQFLQDMCNKRTDQYGGSIEGRCRFPLEVLDAVTKAVGQNKTAIRLSPWELFQGMRMKEPEPTFSHLVRAIKAAYPDFAYLHVTEPRVHSGEDREPQPGESNDFMRAIWAPKPLMSAGGYTRELALEAADKHDNSLVAFGRMFISNPDLPLRLKKKSPLNEYNRATFYTQGKEGYIDYPFLKEGLKAML
ncbi:NADH:flavin oxidoreductase/NADH oxidase [Heliocybe sulcata]|uniref:NADH:flavin oxidoreductase/NADH oxidase n=1 Tax=Heliocybe sulcata TaxID=5364 RepID=A0A5C3MTE2_9AGAM|nr:NADH:flavin oxidoreductase/NADH oxidase [Heliocybe sulcata]